MIVQEVFGFVKRDGPGEVVRSEAEEVWRGLGVQGKGAAAPLPLPPRCRRDEWVSLIILSWTDWVRVGLLSPATVNLMWMRVVLIVFISSILSHAQPCRDIRSADFRNTIIRTSPTDENEMTGLFNVPSGAQTFNFKKGVSEDFLDEAQRKAGTP